MTPLVNILKSQLISAKKKQLVHLSKNEINRVQVLFNKSFNETLSKNENYQLAQTLNLCIDELLTQFKDVPLGIQGPDTITWWQEHSNNTKCKDSECQAWHKVFSRKSFQFSKLTGKELWDMVPHSRSQNKQVPKIDSKYMIAYLDNLKKKNHPSLQSDAAAPEDSLITLFSNYITARIAYQFTNNENTINTFYPADRYPKDNAENLAKKLEIDKSLENATKEFLQRFGFTDEPVKLENTINPEPTPTVEPTETPTPKLTPTPTIKPSFTFNEEPVSIWDWLWGNNEGKKKLVLSPYTSWFVKALRIKKMIDGDPYITKDKELYANSFQEAINELINTNSEEDFTPFEYSEDDIKYVREFDYKDFKLDVDEKLVKQRVESYLKREFELSLLDNTAVEANEFDKPLSSSNGLYLAGIPAVIGHTPVLVVNGISAFYSSLNTGLPVGGKALETFTEPISSFFNYAGNVVYGRNGPNIYFIKVYQYALEEMSYEMFFAGRARLPSSVSKEQVKDVFATLVACKQTFEQQVYYKISTDSLQEIIQKCFDVLDKLGYNTTSLNRTDVAAIDNVATQYLSLFRPFHASPVEYVSAVAYLIFLACIFMFILNIITDFTENGNVDKTLGYWSSTIKGLLTTQSEKLKVNTGRVVDYTSQSISSNIIISMAMFEKSVNEFVDAIVKPVDMNKIERYKDLFFEVDSTSDVFVPDKTNDYKQDDDGNPSFITAEDQIINYVEVYHGISANGFIVQNFLRDKYNSTFNSMDAYDDRNKHLFTDYLKKNKASFDKSQYVVTRLKYIESYFDLMNTKGKNFYVLLNGLKRIHEEYEADADVSIVYDSNKFKIVNVVAS